MTDLLKLMTDASPLVVIVFTIMWCINRICQLIVSWRGDPNYSNLEKSINNLAQEITRQSENTQSIYTKESGKITDALKSIEGATINHTVVHERCAFVNQMAGTNEKYLPLKTQRTLLEYQWNWCRDSFVKIMSQSILNNGIRGQELGVSTRVVNALYHAASDARKSIENIEGMDEYQYVPLFEKDIPEIIGIMWEKALPLYHRDIKSSLDRVLEDFAYSIQQFFDDRLNQSLLTQEDPDTGRIYHKNADHAVCTGQSELTKNLADQLTYYKRSEERERDGESDFPLTPLVKKVYTFISAQ